MEIVRDNPDLVIHARVLTRGGTDREIEEKNLAKFHRDCEPDMVMGPQRADCHQDRRVVAESIPGELSDQLILGDETLRWDSKLLNPVLYLPISAETAQQKARLPADYGEVFTVEKALLETESDHSVN
jgi:hypothetical protein